MHLLCPLFVFAAVFCVIVAGQTHGDDKRHEDVPQEKHTVSHLRFLRSPQKTPRQDDTPKQT